MNEDNIFRFREFRVYNDVREFRRELKEFSKKRFPKEEQYCLTQQLWRALDSILFNIAEGSGRYSDIDFSRFLNTSLTSLNEVVGCLDAALDDKYMDGSEHDYFFVKAESICKQLRSFTSKVRKDNRRKGNYNQSL